MNAIEFVTELHGSDTLTIPREAAERLPKAGSARVLVLTEDDGEDEAAWRAFGYEQFLRDDPSASDWQHALAAIRSQQAARGHQAPSAEAVSQRIADERESWD